MNVILFLLYFAIGGGVGYGIHAYTALGLPLAISGGAITSAILMQIHVLARAGRTNKALEARVDEIEKVAIEADRAVKVTDARLGVIEETIKVELTEQRHALVDEMKNLEGLIARLTRTFEARLAETQTAARVAPQEDAVLRDVKDALRDGRVELHLQPIVSLPQRRVSFYEGLTRLRRPDGSLILPTDFLDAARRANLMAIIDNMTLFRCVQIVRRLAERDRRVGVFCNVASASLEDPMFFPLFFEFINENRDLAGSLIFEIQADRFEKRTSQMRANMNQLMSLGFRFSIDNASSLAFDLPRLQDAGIRFVKINGNLLIDQLRDAHGPRPASSINRRLDAGEVTAVFSRYGVTLIAEKIEDEASVVEILEYEVPYGQGHIFGQPRPIKASLMEDTAPPQALIDRLSNLN